MNKLIASVVFFLLGFASNALSREAEPVKLKVPIVICAAESVSDGETQGFVFTEHFFGDTKDKCVKIVPTERGDTYKIYTGETVGTTDKEKAALFLHGRRTTVDRVASSDLGTLSAKEKSNSKSNRSSQVYVDIGPTGIKILKAFKTNLDLILWAPQVATVGTFDKKCGFTLRCENDGKKFSIAFKSASGDCNEDDMSVSFTAGDSTQKLALKTDQYFYTDHISKTQPSICQGEGQVNRFAAYSIGGNRALLFLRSSGRPGYDHVLTVLLDLQAGKVLDVKDLGPSKSDFVAVLKTEKGFKVRIVRDSLSFHKDVTCDCDAPFVDDWLEVSVADKIHTDWLVK